MVLGMSYDDVDPTWLVLKAAVDRQPYVVGWSRTLKPKIKGGKEYPEIKCIRIYVWKKIPKEKLYPIEIIPEQIENIPTDIVEVNGPDIAEKIKEIDPTAVILWKKLI